MLYHLLTALHVLQRRPVDVLHGLGQHSLAVRVVDVRDQCNVLATHALRWHSLTLLLHRGQIGQHWVTRLAGRTNPICLCISCPRWQPFESVLSQLVSAGI